MDLAVLDVPVVVKRKRDFVFFFFHKINQIVLLLYVCATKTISYVAAIGGEMCKEVGDTCWNVPVGMCDAGGELIRVEGRRAVYFKVLARINAR